MKISSCGKRELFSTFNQVSAQILTVILLSQHSEAGQTSPQQQEVCERSGQNPVRPEEVDGFLKTRNSTAAKQRSQDRRATDRSEGRRLSLLCDQNCEQLLQSEDAVVSVVNVLDLRKTFNNFIQNAIQIARFENETEQLANEVPQIEELLVPSKHSILSDDAQQSSNQLENEVVRLV